MEHEKSLQKKYAEKSICYGCGPANTLGLQIQSYVNNDQVIATFTPQPHHQAFPNVINGGIIGTILDCHCNWTACWFLMKSKNLNNPPCTVTSEYTIKLKRPAPTNHEFLLTAELVEINNDRATIQGKMAIDEKIYATCHGIFVAVSETHPAYHRW